MNLRKSLIALSIVAGLQAGSAHASTDMTCSPDWTLTADRLSGCSNLAFLSPGNDSRVNLQLLLADKGRITLPTELKSDDYESGYAQVPFSVGMLDPQHGADEEENEPPADNVPSLSTLLEKLGVQSGAGAIVTQSFADGEGNRCRSNDLHNAQTFIEQIADNTALSDAERTTLARERINLLTTCDIGEVPAEDESLSEDKLALTSATAKAYGRYLIAAEAFYLGNFAKAHEHFASLIDSDQPWLKETALYMQGRVALNQAQQNAFDEWGMPDLEKVDRINLDASAAGFKAYLQAYPNGRYFASARGLLRKVYWLRGDNAKFIDEFAWQFAQGEGGKRNVSSQELIEELDSKLQPTLKPDDIEDPLLLAMLDLTYLRKPYGDASTKITLEQLQAQKGRFAAEPDLHTYLLAAWHFYRDTDADKTLAALPKPTTSGPLTFIAFSQETLRGLALEAKGDLAAAQSHWQALHARSDNPLQRAQLELALALNYESDGKLAKVFASDSPIKTAPIRQILLRNVANPELLRQQADNDAVAQAERDTALYTLLYKDLVYGQYATFLDDLKRLPQPAPAARNGIDLGLFAWAGGSDAGYACPALHEIAGRLAKNGGDAQAANCLGDFIRVNGLDYATNQERPAANLLGGTPSLFEGSNYSRLAGYIKLIDEPNSSADDKAYALFRAINCYAPSGYNSCDAQDIAKSQRKQWFQTLKTRYAKTQWAQDLKYYW
ncbi:hypothetical protein [Pseudomonas sp. LRF_L74]|uniref:hypothetical protein n=1 Tax=Pseudomonas sp. LRF_L74 TaxID=3369422 RepID=UPI003F610007